MNNNENQTSSNKLNQLSQIKNQNYSLNIDGATNRRQLFQDESDRMEIYKQNSEEDYELEGIENESQRYFPMESQRSKKNTNSTLCIKKISSSVNANSQKHIFNSEMLNSSPYQTSIQNSFKINYEINSQLNDQISQKFFQREGSKKKSKLLHSAYEKYMKNSKFISNDESSMFMSQANIINQGIASQFVVNGNSPLINQQEVYKKNYFIILAYVQKFVKALMIQTAKNNFNVLQNFQFSIINDKSYYPSLNFEAKNKEERGDLLFNRRKFLEKKIINQNLIHFKKSFIERSQILSFLLKFILELKVLQPNSIALIIWESILLVIIIIQLVIVPIKTCFDVDFSNLQWMLILYYVPIICFTIDIFASFHKGFYQFGMVVSDKKQIAENYMKLKLWIDIFCTLILIINLGLNSALLDTLALLLRLQQIDDKKHQINQHFQIQFKFAMFYDLISLIVLVLFVAHINCCGFYLVSQKTQEWNLASNTWVRKQGIVDDSWNIKYIYSFYFSIITMITIGYGDVYPINVYEMIYVIVMAIFSCGVFGYCVNTIGSIFTEIQQKSKQFQKKLYDISTYMNMKSIKKDTQIKILKQLEYLEDQSDEILLKGELILKQCSVELREELIQQYFGKILNNIPILKENFTTQLIDKVSLRMKEKILSPGELFIIQGQTVDNLYIITQGIVEYSTVDKECQRALLQISKDIKLIGFQQFLTRQTSEVSIQAKTATTLAFISYEEFQSITKQIDLDYEKFCMIRDQFKNDRRYYIKCCSCGQYGHELNLCGQLHYVVNRSTFSRRIFHNYIHDKRMSHSRKINYKQNTLGQNQQVRLDFKLYRWTAVQEIYKDYKDINILYEIQYQEKDKDFFRRCPKIKQKKLKFLRKYSLYDKQGISKMLSLQKSVNYGEQSEHFNFDTQMNNEDNQEEQDSSSSSFESSSLSSSSSSEESKIAKQLNGDIREPSQYLKQQQNLSQDLDKSIYSATINSQKNIQQQNAEQQFDTFDEIQDQQANTQNANNEFEDEKKFELQDQKQTQQANKINIQQQNSDQINISNDIVLQGQFLQDFNMQSVAKPQLVRNLSINSQSSKNKTQNLVFQNRMQSNSIASNNNSSSQTDRRHQSVNLNLTDEEQSQFKTSKLGISEIQQNSNPSKKVDKNSEKQSVLSFIEQNQKRNKKVISQPQQNQILQYQQEQQKLTALMENLFEQFKNSVVQNKFQINSFQYLSPNINQKSQTAIKKSNKELLYSNSISSKEESGVIQQQQNDTNTITIGSEHKIKAENTSVPVNTQSIQNTMTNNNFNRTDQNHIFGKLQFKFDKAKEFQIYYPQFNLQSIIKSYKKMKYQLNLRLKPKKLKFFSGTQQFINQQSPTTLFKKQQRQLQQSTFKINDNKGIVSNQDVEMTFNYQ
ncbi:hypothetical protein ABPG73_011517 [Tetrahymena malaccensis]